MDCPACGWPMKVIRQWETNNLACGLLKCDDCECEVSVKTPVDKMKSWPRGGIFA
tara:strand:- start:8420 stop:8584 length:165 start_codon:yes stop_codon:yes gene_type:complete